MVRSLPRFQYHKYAQLTGKAREISIMMVGSFNKMGNDSARLRAGSCRMLVELARFGSNEFAVVGIERAFGDINPIV